MLIRYHEGERQVWQVVYVPSVEAEDQRHLHRDLATLKQERGDTTRRIKGLLSSQGLRFKNLTRIGKLKTLLRGGCGCRSASRRPPLRWMHPGKTERGALGQECTRSAVCLPRHGARV